METNHQAQIFKAMAKPNFYPHDVSAIEQRDTHISKVFLTGRYAYKIKKAVNLDFLDFTALDKRKYFCRQEVVLNRRLSKGIYLGMLPITFKDGRYHFAGSGKPVEYVVKMRQLPENLSMLSLAHNGTLYRNSIEALARLLADFYRHAPGGEAINRFGSWQTIWTNTEENFRQTEPFAGDFLDTHMFHIVRAATRAFLIRRKALFDRRVEKKKIRDCHGDLRSGHIYFSDHIQIIDCIEFNDRFRYADITSDLAFLAMDLEFEGYPKIVQHLINTYLEYTKDEEMLILLDFYKCYRACVRLKVNCFRLQNSELSGIYRARVLRDTEHYLNLAYRYAVQFTRPTVWVVCGLPAAGKTTVAKMLAKVLSLPILRSDVVRKRLFDLLPAESRNLPFEEGIYSKEATALVYGKLLMLAQEEIKKDCSIILDATFSRGHQREEALRLAKDLDANIIFVECTASDDILRERLSKRDVSTSVSDARLHHFTRLRQRFEPLDELPDKMYIRINTEKALEEGVRKIISHDYALLSYQTARVIKQLESSALNVTEPT